MDFDAIDLTALYHPFWIVALLWTVTCVVMLIAMMIRDVFCREKKSDDDWSLPMD